MRKANHPISVFVAAYAAFMAISVPVNGADPELQRKAIDILRKSCASCHGDGNEKSGDIDFITDAEQLLASELVDLAQPDESPILVRMLNGDDPMPPEDAPASVPRPTQSEIEILRQWIGSQAKPIVVPQNLPGQLGERAVEPQFAAIRQFLDSEPPKSPSRWRFFSFENLQRLKSSENARNKAFQRLEIASHRAALAKAINSLSWSAEMAILEPVGQDQLIIAIDLASVRDVDGKPWSSSNFWPLIESEYPYGIEPEDRDFVAIQKATETRIPIVRADWFVATALRPPLYNELLGIPNLESTLHEILGVTVLDNIRAGLANRVGFTQSGISKNANRLIERHPSRYGYYWRSYDFLPGSRKGNLFQFPTGPEFPGNPHPELAFQHDGGEIVFSLPNGLQGYMLVNKAGDRIDKGPAELVSDDKRVSGSPEVVNGVSCIACHRHGIYPFPKDEIASQSAVAGEVRDFVNALHDSTTVEHFKTLDRNRFLAALDKAIGPWLRVDGGDERKVTSFPEPITLLASHYVNSELGIAEVAAELGIDDQKRLMSTIQFDTQLRDLGLAPLMTGGLIKRNFWQGNTSGQSPAQQAARILDAGIPIKVVPTRR